MKAAHLSDNLPGDRKPERRPGRQTDSKTSRDTGLGPGLSCLLGPYNWRDNQVNRTSNVVQSTKLTAQLFIKINYSLCDL